MCVESFNLKGKWTSLSKRSPFSIFFQALKTTELFWAYKQHYVFLAEVKQKKYTFKEGTGGIFLLLSS